MELGNAAEYNFQWKAALMRFFFLLYLLSIIEEFRVINASEKFSGYSESLQLERC